MKSGMEVIAIGVIVIVLAAAVLFERNRTAAPVAATSSADAAKDASNSFAVRNARVFDGERVIESATVVVTDGRIVAVGTDAAIPAGMIPIDASGKTLMPGLIDAHTHSWGDAQRDALRFGVTTAIDMHGDSSRLPALKSARESLARTDQADLWAAGTAVTVPGGHGTQYGFPIPTVDPSTDIAAFIGARIGEGADFIKLIIEDLGAYSAERRWPTLTATQAADVVSATHRAGRIAVAHVTRHADAERIVAAGVDGLAHVFIDAPASAAFIEAAKRGDVFVIPTLSVMAGGSGAGDGRSLAADKRLEPTLTRAQSESLGTVIPAIQQNATLRDNAMASVRNLHAAGVSVLAGTDAGNPGTAHGVSMHGEIELLVRAGLSTQDALIAATSAPAKRFGMAERGRIAPGLRADMILLDGDPLRDITATRAIAVVWKNGFVVDRLLPAVAAPTASSKAPAQSSVSDFDSGDVQTTFGTAWQDTSDQMAGGASVAQHRLIADGAQGSAGALEISGEIKVGFAYPWAGAMFFTATTPMQPVDYSARTELVFQVRGDGREYRAMLFAGASEQAIPSTQDFIAG
ncbi:MAG: CIA30 family protein, partial [Dokdonella sp.]